LTEDEINALSDNDRCLYFKKQGNLRYKKKQLDEALEFYTKALEVDGKRVEVYNNIAAVYFEKKEYETCVEKCRKGIEVGREVFADFKLIAKAFARIGNAMMKLARYGEAVQAFEDSLTEDRVYDVEQKLKEAKKQKRIADEKAYVNPELGMQAKEEANALFKAGNFAAAMEKYNEAVKRDPTNHIHYSNRAACYTKLGEFPLGIADCDKAIELCPTFLKAYSRKAGIHIFMKEYHKALQCYENGLKVDENNQDMKDGIARVRAMVMSESHQQGDEQGKQQRAERAMNDPEIRNIMQDPIMRQVLNDIQTNPAAAQKHLANPDIMGKLQKLIDAGVIQVR